MVLLNAVELEVELVVTITKKMKRQIHVIISYQHYLLKVPLVLELQEYMFELIKDQFLEQEDSFDKSVVVQQVELDLALVGTTTLQMKSQILVIISDQHYLLTVALVVEA